MINRRTFLAAAVSAAAAACGVAEGMTGRDALLLMERA